MWEYFFLANEIAIGIGMRNENNLFVEQFFHCAEATIRVAVGRMKWSVVGIFLFFLI